MSEKKHLPLFGVGPMIIFGQYIITAAAIIAGFVFDISVPNAEVLKIPFIVIGILLIGAGIYLDLSAKLKSKLFKNVENNHLITDGIYAVVRNPVYSGALLACTGAVLIVNNLLLLIVPVICWAYMSVFLIRTEEKWLTDLYGDEFTEYCRHVNRCIPWFPSKSE